LNRITGKAYSVQTCQNGQLPAGTAVVSYTYDVGQDTKGLLSSVSDQSGSTSYSYDPLGRVTREQRTISGVSKSVGYDYNLDGSVNVIHYPSGAAVAYTPDSAGRIVSVIDSVNGINYITGATYAPDNSIAGFVNGNSGTFAGITNAFTYNVRLQPVNVSAVTPGQQKVISLGYDFHLGNGTSGSDNGNVYGFSNGKDPDRSRTFNYDALNRLTSAQTAGADCSARLADGNTKNWGNNYSYDPWGNLLSKTPTKCGAENQTWSVNTKNRLVNSLDAAGKPITSYAFDAAGNLTNDGGLTYDYDAENRIKGTNGFTYIYDAAGNRVKKTNGTTGTLYWYAAVGVIAETDLTGNNPKEYVFFNGTRIARKDANGQVFYYFSDHLKTASVITDSSGNIKSESDFDPWGVERQVVGSFDNTYKFTGKERDGETGLDYFGARYYSSNIGRFMTPDWAAKAVAVPYANYGNPQSLNLYSYVQNNPTTLGDTDGHTEKQNVAPEVNGPPVIHDNGNNTYTATQVVQTKSAYSVVTLPDGTRGTQQSVVTTTYTATFDSANQIAQGTTPESTTTATVNTYDGSGKQVSSTLIQGPTVELSAKDNRVVGLQDAAKHWWNANVGDSMLALGLATATTGKAMTKAGAPAGPVVAGVGVAIAGVGAVAKVTGTTWQNVAAWGQSMNPCNGDVCIPMP
jgi:RHS repeat-associated protein